MSTARGWSRGAGHVFTWRANDRQEFPTTKPDVARQADICHGEDTAEEILRPSGSLRGGFPFGGVFSPESARAPYGRSR